MRFQSLASEAQVNVFDNYQRPLFHASITWINIIHGCEASVSDLAFSSLRVRWISDANVHTTAAYHPNNDHHALRIPMTTAPWASDYLLPKQFFEVTLDVEGSTTISAFLTSRLAWSVESSLERRLGLTQSRSIISSECHRQRIGFRYPPRRNKHFRQSMASLKRKVFTRHKGVINISRSQVVTNK